ncbi:MAG: YidC/Oxa1 family membrane protein insertase [bacterium]|nr:YidC/Oxa1 family membrane protein insertase [bacterium]
MSKKFFTWILILIGVTLALQTFQGHEAPEESHFEDFVLETSDGSYYVGDPVLLTVSNHLEHAVTIESACPSEPLSVERYSNGIWTPIHSMQGLYLSCLSMDALPDPSAHLFEQPARLEFPAQSDITIDYSPWKDELFSSLGRYRLILDVPIDGVEKSFNTEFEMVERGFFSSVTHNLFFRPIFNFMWFLTSIMPGYNFGLAIIALTLVIRFLLLGPSRRALKSQRAMSKLQPELDAIKKKYAGNQEKISRETLALWKTHKVNPAGGCLPLLIQLPILIALFYVVQVGFSPYLGHMFYDFQKTIDLSMVDSNFFGILDLGKINATWLPIVVGLLQFFQLKLSFAKMTPVHKPSHGTEVVELDEDGKPLDVRKKEVTTLPNTMATMNKTMTYFMPLMIGFMTATLPSAVGLYLTVSTLFAIVQQYFVNKEV